MKKPSNFLTTFNNYKVVNVIGEGGCGFVYHAIDDDKRSYAIKVLNPEKSTREKLKRFKNEFLFCYISCISNAEKLIFN